MIKQVFVRGVTYFVHALKTLFAPAYCVGCRALLSDYFFCKPCLGMLRPLASVKIMLTKKQSATMHSLGLYQDPLVSLVWAKYYGNRLAAQQLGYVIADRTVLSFIEFDYIVPVPLHWSRYAWRWYNQSEIMAQAVSERTGKPVVSLVKRVLFKKPQASLSRDERTANMAGVFTLAENAMQYKGKSFLVIDDVATSGATIRNVLHCLTKLAPVQLHAVVACRTLSGID